MIIFETEAIAVIDRAPGVKSFRFKTDKRLSFKPGQFFLVGIMINGQEQTKHFSFSNSPTEAGYIEFTKRLTGSDFSDALNHLKPGDWAKIKAPYGNFTFSGEYKKIAFLSGGIGITPIRSISKYVVDKGLPTDIVLLYGNSTERDIIFKKDFDLITETKSSFKVVYTLTSKDMDRDNWQGRAGYVDADMIAEEVPDYNDRVFYICGPPAMVEVLNRTLQERLHVPKERIIIENFTGY
jgi:ferredoxin-NADP reductase